MRAYAHTLANADIRSRSTLGIRRVRSEYADIRRRTLCYTQRQTHFLDMFKIYQRMRAYSIYVTHTLTVRTTYTGYARHTINTLKIRYSYATHTLVKACSREAGLKVVRISFSEICIGFQKFAYAIHTVLRWHRGDMEKDLKYRYYYVATQYLTFTWPRN